LKNKALFSALLKPIIGGHALSINQVCLMCNSYYHGKPLGLFVISMYKANTISWFLYHNIAYF